MKVEWNPYGEVMTLKRRSVSVNPTAEYREIGVRSFGRGLFTKQAVSGAELGDKRVFEIHPGDLILSNVFAWEGAVGSADDRHVEMIGSHRFMTWVPTGGADVDFLRHFFGSDLGIEALGAASPGSAGRNRTLSIKNLSKLKVPTPPPPEQSRVVQFLDNLAAVFQPRRCNAGLAVDGAVHSWLDGLPQERLCDVAEISPRRRNPDTREISFVPMAAVDAATGEIADPEVRSRTWQRTPPASNPVPTIVPDWVSQVIARIPTTIANPPTVRTINSRRANVFFNPAI